MSAGTWSAWGSACRSRGICLGRDISARTLVWNPFLAKHDAKTSSIFFPQLSPILRSFKEKLRCQPPPLEYDAIEEVHLHLSCLNNSLSMWCSPPQHTIWRPGNFHMVQLLCLGSTMIPKKTKLAKLMSCIIYFFTRWFIFSPSSPSSLPLLLFLQKNPFGFRCRAPPPNLQSNLHQNLHPNQPRLVAMLGSFEVLLPTQHKTVPWYLWVRALTSCFSLKESLSSCPNL